VLRGIRRLVRRPDAFLGRSSGIIHVGANDGWERHAYAKHRLRVAWIEALPDAFSRLEQNISSIREQRAICAVLTDREDAVVRFNVASNSGKSSSMFDLGDHVKIHPHISYTATLELRSRTLDGLFADGTLARPDYDALVLDTQGSELLVLQGAQECLTRMKFVKTEAADFELYRGGCRLDALREFLGRHGFREALRDETGYETGLGSTFDVLFKRG